MTRVKLTYRTYCIDSINFHHLGSLFPYPFLSLLVIGLVWILSACGGGSNGTTIACTTEARSSMSVTVLDNTGQVAQSEVLEIDRLVGNFSNPSPVKFVHCGPINSADIAAPFEPTATFDTCSQMALGIEQSGSFAFRQLTSNGLDVEVAVPRDVCHVITQTATLTQGIPNPLACDGSVNVVCPPGSSVSQLILPSPQGCNPTLPLTNSVILSDVLCSLTPNATACSSCNAS
jgi:hypothetical protein